jgi:hypothetical protein
MPYYLNFAEEEPEEPGPPEYIPAGVYSLRIVRYVEKVTQAGATYLQWEFKVLHPDVHPDFRLYLGTVFSPFGLHKLKELVFAVTGEDVTGVADYRFDPSRGYIGQDIDAEVSIDLFRGKQHNRVEALFPFRKGPRA